MPFTSAVRLRADILVISQEGRPRLLVETKRGRYATSHIVVGQLDRVIPPDCYFLVVTPKQYWLTLPLADMPAHEGETTPLLERYIDTERVPLNSLGDAEFASVVASWLGSIMFKSAEVLLTIPAQRWLVETGLHQEISRGYIKREVAYN